MPFRDPHKPTASILVLDPATFTDTDATPSVTGGSNFITGNTGATTITQFDDGIDGQHIRIEFGDTNTTIQAGANIRMQGGNTSPTYDFGPGNVGDVIWFTKSGTEWIEDTRSLNSA